MDSFETRYTYSLGQSSHVLLLRFLNFVFFYESSFKSLLFLQYLMDSFEIRYWLADFEIICGF